MFLGEFILQNFEILIIILLSIIILLLLYSIFHKPAATSIEEIIAQAIKSIKRDQDQFKEEMLYALQLIDKNNGDGVARLGQSMLQSVTSNVNVMRDAQVNELKHFNTSTNDMMQLLAQRLESLTASNEEKLEAMRSTLHTTVLAMQQANDRKMEAMRKELADGLLTIQQENDKKLEDIRLTVSEKLQSTLEERLALSFNTVNKQLENVFKGIGEMQNLATEVGSLKKVLGNVKLRGNLGEIQLESIIQEILTVDQYETNIATIPGSSERVEFAVRLPGKDDTLIYLPIDSKFPADLYNQLQKALEAGDKELIKIAKRNLRMRILSEAKTIQSKYVRSPYTTDFAIMFLPFEGLYAEVLELDIFTELQNKYHIMLAGPNTMAAMLNSLRMGFKTLALQKRTSEVWKTLEAVKTEFNQFGTILSNVQEHLNKSSRDLDKLIGTRTNAINRKLRSFDDMNLTQAETILNIADKTIPENNE